MMLLCMLSQVVLLKEFEGKKAVELVNVCPAQVFDIEDMGEGEVKAFLSFLENLKIFLLAFD